MPLIIQTPFRRQPENRLSAGIVNENAEVRFDTIEKEHAALRVNDPKESPQTVLIFLVRFFIKKKMNEEERDSYVANAPLNDNSGTEEILNRLPAT